MLYSKYLPLVWAGIWRKRGRAVLMLLQIASAFALFGLLEGFNAGIKLALAKTHGDRLYIGSSVSLGDPLPISQLTRIRSTSGVASVTMRSQLPASYQQPTQGVGVLAADVGAFFAIYDNLSVSPADLEALKNNRTGVIVGKVTMEKYGWKPGDRVVLQSPLPKTDGSKDWAFDVVGAYESIDDADNSTALICNYTYYDESRAFGRDTVQMYVAKIDSAANADAISLAIDNAFANSDHETRTQTEAALAASQVQRIGDLNFLVRAIVAAVFFAMLFATGALMMQSIRERMPELAVLKTVGFSDRLVMGLIITEAVTFCLFSAGIGLTIAYLAFPAARQFIGIATLPAVTIASGLVFAVLLGLIGSFVPARRGLKLQVAEALAVR